MKKERNLFTCLLLSLFLTACGGGGDSGSSGGGDNGGAPPPTSCWSPGGGDGTEGKKLLSKISVEGEEDRTFRYDAQNRLIADSALGEGNKIEYEGDSPCPSLVTNGTPYPTVSIYDDSSGIFVQTPIVYARYQYGEDDLLDGTSQKYYQTQSLGQNENPFYLGQFHRYYLDSNGRIIADGYYYGLSGGFSPTAWTFSYIYDERGNLLKKTKAPSSGIALLETAWEYIYDSKKSPASGMVTPLWWFGGSYNDHDLDELLYSHNNPLSYTVTAIRTNYQPVQVVFRTNETYNYIYDQDGYPTAVDVTRVRYDESHGEQTTNYRKTFEYIPAH